jgi:hypothetical protein
MKPGGSCLAIDVLRPGKFGFTPPERMLEVHLPNRFAGIPHQGQGLL